MPIAMALTRDHLQVGNAHFLAPSAKTAFCAFGQTNGTKMGTAGARRAMTALARRFGERKLWSMLPLRADVTSPSAPELVGGHAAA